MILTDLVNIAGMMKCNAEKFEVVHFDFKKRIRVIMK